MAQVGVRDGEGLVAGPLTALVDFVGVGRAPVVRRRDFEFGGFAFCHAAMMARHGGRSKRSYYRLFTHCSQVVGHRPSLRLALAAGAWHSDRDMRETFRVWAESLFTFGQEVIFEERRGKRAAIFRSLLFGISKLYQVGVKVHRWLINIR